MPTTSEFQGLYAQLNPRQREAVDAIEGPVMVIAGPGTGKTKILTLRIANILAKTDTTPESILALTFTEAGATEMRSRLAQIIGADAYRVKVTTFHSFCNDIIQQHPESLGVIAGATAISETDQIIILQELLENTEGLDLLRPTGAPLLYLKAVHSAINTLKREGVTANALRDTANREESAVMNAPDVYHEKGAYKGKMKGEYSEHLKQIAKIRELAGVYEKYQSTLRERGFYDYNDMIMEVSRVLDSDEHLRLVLQEQHQYILVDEHQDTNNAQNHIIELLASFWKQPNLFIVGDAKQAIYRFQGASLENFLYFKDLYKDVRLIELQENYRSSQAILDAAQGIRASSGEGLTSQSDHPNKPIEVLSLSTQDVERYTVAKHIAEQIAQETRPEDIAVLYRDNSDGQALALILDKVGIPYTVAADVDVMSDPDMRKLILILDAVRDFGQAEALLIALHVDLLRVEPLDVYKLADFCRWGRNPYDVMRSPDLMHQAGIDGADRLIELAGSLAHWHNAARNQNTLEAFELVVRESGMLDAVLSHQRSGEKLAKLHSLYDMARSLVQRQRTYTLLDFIDHLRFIREHGLIVRSAASLPMPGRVRLMTAHRSKGLEFDHVYLLGVTDDHWGPRNRRELIKLPQSVFLKKTALSEASAEDDERNLFYVALTRARKKITITLAQRNTEGSELLACRYISEMKPELLEYPDTALYETDWIAHRDIHFAPRPTSIPDISDKEYLNDIFLRQGLSATALNNYLECPWKYFYRNLIRVPEAPTFPLMYGSAIDRALQEYFEHFKEGESVDKTFLIAAFKGFLRNQPLQEQELTTALTRGEHSLSGYFDAYHSTWHRNVINQLKVPAVPFVLDDGQEITLNGKMDRVDIIDQANHVFVIDYKTGRPKTRRDIMGLTKDANGDYLRQLTFYTLLLDHFRDGYYTMIKGIIDFIDPDLKGIWRKEEFIIEKTQTEELATTIRKVAGGIMTLSFWNATCDDKDCRYCKLRTLIQ